MQPSPLSPSNKGGILVADSDLEKYCALAIEAGATHAKQIHPSSVVTALPLSKTFPPVLKIFNMTPTVPTIFS